MSFISLDKKISIPKCTYFCMLCFLCFSRIDAQENTADNDMLESLLTEIAAQNEDEQDLEQMLATLEDLADNPVYINQADFEDVSRISWLTEFQIRSLLDYVKKQGPVLSHYEIASLYGFTPELAQTLAPFISLEKQPDVSIKPERVLRFGKSKLITGVQAVLQKQEGYLRPDSVENRYTGSPVKTYLRYSFSYANQIYFGITAEKDPGEVFFRKENPYGFDFYSAHFQMNTKGRLKTLTLGDYQANFGQGLVLWSGLNYGKSVMVRNAMRYNEGLRKYSSVGENRFMRGIGVTYRLNPFDVSVFYSRKAIDATVSVKDNEGKPVEVSSFPTDGYHRTPNEMAKKDAVAEQVAGANISMSRTNWHLGITAVHYGYNAALVPEPYIYNHFAFSGRSGSNYSVDFRFRLGDAIFYGEQALSQNGALGMLYGIQMLISGYFGVSVLYRRYPENFHALYGMALGENTRNNNEEGFYMGWNWNPGGQWRFSSYWDIFRFPWLRYRADAPSSGQDILLQADYMPSRVTRMYIQARYKEKEENKSNQVISAISPVKTASAKAVFSHQVTEGSGIGNHLEIKNCRQNSSSDNGYFIAQDVYTTINAFGRYPLKITFRYAFFDTDAYDSRIYSFENDMLYAFSIPAFSGQGTRLYVLLKCSLGKQFDLRLKYAATHYTDRKTTGSGLSVVQGDRYSELKMQLVCKF